MVQVAAEHVLLSTRFETCPRYRSVDAYRDLASMRLVRFGVPPRRIRMALARVGDALDLGAIFEPEGVLRVLAELLPDEHPASRRGRARVIPTEGAGELTSSIQKSFLGGSSLWDAIRHASGHRARQRRADR